MNLILLYIRFANRIAWSPSEILRLLSSTCSSAGRFWSCWEADTMKFAWSQWDSSDQ